MVVIPGGSAFVSDSYTTSYIKNAGDGRGTLVGVFSGGPVKVTDVFYWDNGCPNNTSGYASGSSSTAFAYDANKSPVVKVNDNDTPLIEILNNNQNVWEEAKCNLKTGPVNSIPGKTFTIPVIKGMIIRYL